jgi:hypothetical protein
MTANSINEILIYVDGYEPKENDKIYYHRDFDRLSKPILIWDGPGLAPMCAPTPEFWKLVRCMKALDQMYEYWT